MPDFQRLEFLGDAVLGVILVDYLWTQYPYYDGTRLVNQAAKGYGGIRQNQIFKELQLHRFVQQTNVPLQTWNASGDIIEAIVGAIYINGRSPLAREFVLRHWKLKEESNVPGWVDFCNKLGCPFASLPSSFQEDINKPEWLQQQQLEWSRRGLAVIKLLATEYAFRTANLDAPPRSIIVHRDSLCKNRTLFKIGNYLQLDMLVGQPVTLKEGKNRGKKFEAYHVSLVHMVFAELQKAHDEIAIDIIRYVFYRLWNPYLEQIPKRPLSECFTPSERAYKELQVFLLKPHVSSQLITELGETHFYYKFLKPTLLLQAIISRSCYGVINDPSIGDSERFAAFGQSALEYYVVANAPAGKPLDKPKDKINEVITAGKWAFKLGFKKLRSLFKIKSVCDDNIVSVLGAIYLDMPSPSSVRMNRMPSFNMTCPGPIKTEWASYLDGLLEKEKPKRTRVKKAKRKPKVTAVPECRVPIINEGGTTPSKPPSTTKHHQTKRGKTMATLSMPTSPAPICTIPKASPPKTVVPVPVSQSGQDHHNHSTILKERRQVVQTTPSTSSNVLLERPRKPLEGKSSVKIETTITTRATTTHSSSFNDSTPPPCASKPVRHTVTRDEKPSLPKADIPLILEYTPYTIVIRGKRYLYFKRNPTPENSPSREKDPVPANISYFSEHEAIARGQSQQGKQVVYVPESKIREDYETRSVPKIQSEPVGGASSTSSRFHDDVPKCNNTSNNLLKFTDISSSITFGTINSPTYKDREVPSVKTTPYYTEPAKPIKRTITPASNFEPAVSKASYNFANPTSHFPSSYSYPRGTPSPDGITSSSRTPLTETSSSACNFNDTFYAASPSTRERHPWKDETRSTAGNSFSSRPAIQNDPELLRHKRADFVRKSSSDEDDSMQEKSQSSRFYRESHIYHNTRNPQFPPSSPPPASHVPPGPTPPGNGNTRSALSNWLLEEFTEAFDRSTAVWVSNLPFVIQLLIAVVYTIFVLCTGGIMIYFFWRFSSFMWDAWWKM